MFKSTSFTSSLLSQRSADVNGWLLQRSTLLEKTQLRSRLRASFAHPPSSRNSCWRTPSHQKWLRQQTKASRNTRRVRGHLCRPPVACSTAQFNFGVQQVVSNGLRHEIDERGERNGEGGSTFSLPVVADWWTLAHASLSTAMGRKLPSELQRPIKRGIT